MLSETFFSPEEIRRYGRHFAIPGVGKEGQQKLKAARVLVVGAGGLGSPLCLYLAAAGVGRLGIVDHDIVEESNLQRQILHSTRSVGKPKLESAKDRLLGLNPFVDVVLHEGRLTSQNALVIFNGYDIIADGTDNFPSRYLVNDASVLARKPNVYGSMFRFEGQVSVFHPAGGGPCYRCLYPEPPPPGIVPSCAEGGVLGALPGVIGALQAVETLKMILGLGSPLIGELILFDGLAMELQKLKVHRNPACPLCGENPVLKELIDYEAFCGLRPAPPTRGPGGFVVLQAEDLKAKLDRGDRFSLIDVRTPEEHALASLPGDDLIPLKSLPDRLGELDRESEIVLYCKTGGRSAHAAKLLVRSGFERVSHLAGGIDAWTERIDPSLPRY